MSPVRYMVLAALVLTCPCFGREAVYLSTGFSLEVDSHIKQDERFVFRVGEGSLEFPADLVTRIEVIPEREVPHPVKTAVPAAPKPEAILKEAAYNQGLDEDFVRSVAKIESGLRTDAVSPKGATGLMQLMPSTAAELGVRPGDVRDNANGGALYLRDLLIRYHGNSALALAAYNAGPGAVAKFAGVPPYSETQHYVLQVLREYERQMKAKANTTAAARAIGKDSAAKQSP